MEECIIVEKRIWWSLTNLKNGKINSVFAENIQDAIKLLEPKHLINWSKLKVLNSQDARVSFYMIAPKNL